MVKMICSSKGNFKLDLINVNWDLLLKVLNAINRFLMVLKDVH